MKNLKPFGPSIGKTKISKKFLDLLNKEIDNNILTKNNDRKTLENFSKFTCDDVRDKLFRSGLFEAGRLLEAHRDGESGF